MAELAIKMVGVIGAGTMGCGIAAHLVNLGFEVALFDITQQQAVEGFERTKVVRPPQFLSHERAGRIRLGNLTDNLEWVRELDWVIEAIYENEDAKRQLYATLEPYLKPSAWLSTNTSGLPISDLARTLPEARKAHFLGTHFFNPPRYLKLLELIPTAQTDPTWLKDTTAFLEDRVARRVVLAKDTPGFIANRFGMWSMFHATRVAERLHLPIEAVDAITGPFIGRPKSGTFRLNDLVGLDVMRDIANNLRDRASGDPHVKALELSDSMVTLLSRNWIGEKAGQGYYQRHGKELLSLDLQTFAYRQRIEPDLPRLAELHKLPIGERIRAAMAGKDEVSEYLREYLIPALRYADALKTEICHSVEDFDRVMRWGFGWSVGPFELIDEIGAEACGLSGEPNYRGNEVKNFVGGYAPSRREPQFRPLTSYGIVTETETYRLRDLEDDVFAVSSKTKMGVITPQFVTEFTDLIKSKRLNRFVWTSESTSFSMGFDLKFFLSQIEAEKFDDIERGLKDLQALGELLETQRCVAAIHGYGIGGGFELALSCPMIVAGVESQMGFPEVKVGLYPGGRGTVLMRLNNQFSAKRLSEAAILLTEGTLAPNAEVARTMGYLRSTDLTVYHPDRILYEAKQAALKVETAPRVAWKTMEGPLIGMIDRAQHELKQTGVLSDHDELIGDKIKSIFAKSSSYEEAIAKETTGFLELCQKALTQARIRHMVESNKPLRN